MEKEKTLFDVFKFLFFLVFFIFLFEFIIDLRAIITFIVSFFVPFCEIKENIFYCGGHTFEIVKECTGILSYSIFLAILFSDWSNVNRFWIFVGLISVFLWNILRILLVIYSNGSEFIHASGWIISSILIISFVWLSYLKK